MSRSFARDKGARGEREVLNAMQRVVDKVISELRLERAKVGREGPDQLQLLRNSLQSAVGGYDLVGIDWIAVEVKRQEKELLQPWWNQTLESIRNKPSLMPVLVHRGNGLSWKVRMYGYLLAGDLSAPVKIKCPVDITFDAFLIWFEWELRSRLA